MPLEAEAERIGGAVSVDVVEATRAEEDAPVVEDNSIQKEKA